jgi:putative ABC transport system permease protein
MNVKAPLYTAVIVGAIALAIATNTVVFALLDAVLLKPLPYSDPQQIGVLWQRMEHGKDQVFQTLGSSEVDAVLKASRVFESATASMGQDSVSSAGGALSRMPVMRNYFSTLGVQPALGTFFTKDSSDRAAVISYDLWRKRYGQSADTLGKRLPLDGTLYTIVGVAPAGMLDPTYGNLAQSDVWTIIPKPAGGSMFVVFPIVRLKNGVTWEAAQADLVRVQRNLKGMNVTFPGATLFTGPLDRLVLASARGFLWMVFAAVTGVLLIACANVANLLLVRASMRHGEFEVRSAIGASARRIASQVLTEALLLAVVGAAIGLAVAWAALPWAKGIVPGEVPRLQTAHIDVTVLLYVCGLLFAVTLLTGTIPAYRPKRTRGRDAASRLRAVLVVAQVAIAFAMTAGFGLMLQSFVSLTNVRLGFSPHNLYAAAVTPRRNVLFSIKLGSTPSQAVQSEVRQIRAIPGVEDVSAATGVPFQNAFVMTFLLSRGWNGTSGTPSTPLSAIQIGESYFHVMGIPLLAGRAFQSGDFAGKSPAVIVNEAFARAYFPHQNAVGKHIRYSSSPKDLWQIAGVAGDTRSSLRRVAQPLLYLPFNGGFGPYYGFAIRTSKEVPGLTKQIAAILEREQRGAGTVSVTKVDDLIAKDASSTRTSLALLGALAAVALLLGLCGVYSVVAYGTERRFHEIGIRMAVGAGPRDVLRLVLGNTIVQGLAGVAAGVLLCAFTTRLLESELYDTSPLDARTLIGASAVLVLCTAGAALVPACRAAFSKPVSTLRYE